MSADWSNRRLHFIGIGGAGMSGLALVCDQLGATVSGSDRAESSYLERLRSAGLDPAVGHDGGNLPEDAEVVVSTAISTENPEMALALGRDQRILHRGELLAELCAEKRLIAIAGTHGKTTTTAMLIWALRESGDDPSFFIGGELPGAGADGDDAVNAGWGTGEWVIAEADESDASFLKLAPEIAVITNVEMDHHARWGSLAELHAAFESFAEPAKGVVAPVDPSLDVIAARGPSIRFTEDAPGPSDLNLVVPGKHNILNARAAIAALELAGLDTDQVIGALAGFPGVRRRQELKGSRNGARIYDDYAHHPTEVAAALEAMRSLQPEHLIAVFQPHLFSRTRAFADAFGEALTLADEVVVLEIYPAREEPIGELAGVSGLSVAEAAADHGGGMPIWWLPRADSVVEAMAPRLAAGDVLVTIGAGDVFKIGERLVEQCGRHAEQGQ